MLLRLETWEFIGITKLLNDLYKQTTLLYWHLMSNNKTWDCFSPYYYKIYSTYCAEKNIYLRCICAYMNAKLLSKVFVKHQVWGYPCCHRKEATNCILWENRANPYRRIQKYNISKLFLMVAGILHDNWWEVALYTIL